MDFLFGYKARWLAVAKHSPVIRYGSLCLIIVAATLLTLTIPPLQHSTPFLFFLGAVALSAWFGDRRLGWQAVLLAAFSHVALLFVTARLPLTVTAYGIQLVAFLVVAGGLCELIHALQQAQLIGSIQQTEKRFADLIASVPGVVWEAWGQPDAQAQRIDFVSDYVETWLGYSVAEWLATPNFWLTIVHPADKEQAARKAVADFRSGIGGVNQFRWVAKDGRIYACEAVTTVIKNATGQPIGMRGITFDRTAIWLAEQAARENEARFRSIFESNMLAIGLWEGSGALSEANDALLKLLGYTQEDLHNNRITWSNLTPPEYRHLEQQAMQEARQHGQCTPYEKEYVRKDGTRVPVLVGGAWLTPDGEKGVFFALDISVQRRTTAALRASEERLRLATTVGGFGIYDHDIRANHTRFSDLYHAITGFPLDTPPTREAWLACVHPADRALVEQTLHKAITAGESYQYTYRILHPQRGVRWLEVCSRVTCDETGQPVRLTGILRDITAHKVAEEALRESEERFRAAFEQAAVGVALISVEGDYLQVNDCLCTIVGYRREELLQKTMQTLTHPDDLPASLAQARRLLAGEITSYSLEKRYLHQNGTSVWVNLTVSAVQDATGKIQYYVAITEDISERKAAEARLLFLSQASAVLAASLDYAKTLQQVTELLVPQLADWCTVDLVEPDGSIGLAAVAHVNPDQVQWARAWRQQTPLAHQTDAGVWQVIRTGEAAFYPDLSAEFLAQAQLSSEQRTLLDTLRVKSVLMVPLRVRTQIVGALTLVWSESDRRYGTADLQFAEELAQRIALALDNARLYQQTHATALQLSELTATLEQRVASRTAALARRNQELDQFAYVASHDLKAPLRGINQLATWIQQDVGEQLPPSTQAHLAKLQERVRRMEKLLSDLLVYVRADRQHHSAVRVDTAALIQDVVALLAPPAGFQVTYGEELPVFITVRVPLETVFRNLIANAIKHHPHPATGHVHISAQEHGHWFEFAVRDNGAGIDPTHHARIFEMFQTLTPHPTESTGMGLAMVKKMVESQGGAIRVESSEGQGAVFCFRWPKAPRAE